MRPGSGKGAEPDAGPDAALRLLGLARRAGRVEPGVDASRKAIDAGRARLLLVAEDASPVQLEKVMRPAERRDVPMRRAGSRARLGRAVGGSALTAVVVTDAGFAEQLLRRLDGSAPDPSTPD